MNLIFAEMVMALFGVPVNFAASLQKGWKMGQTVCEAFGFSITLESKLQWISNLYIQYDDSNNLIISNNFWYLSLDCSYRLCFNLYVDGTSGEKVR